MNAHDQVITDERLDSLERWKDERTAWEKDMEQRFAEAFPGGDHVGHCRYHGLMIESIEWRKRLVRTLMEKSIAGLVWGTLAFFGFAAWAYIKSLVRAP